MVECCGYDLSHSWLVGGLLLSKVIVALTWLNIFVYLFSLKVLPRPQFLTIFIYSSSPLNPKSVCWWWFNNKPKRPYS